MSLKMKTLFFFLTVFTFAGFCTMAFLVTRNQIIHFDQAIISSIQSLETPLLTSIMKFFTFIGAGSSIKILAAISIIVLFFFFKHRSELILFTVVLIGSHYLFRMLKQLFQRVRPDLHRLIDIGGYSFPSGHATNAITVYGILSFLLWRHIPTRLGRMLLVFFSIIFIFLIGFSRIYLGVHYPSDVIAGYFAGGFWLIIAIWFYQYILEKLYDKKTKDVV